MRLLLPQRDPFAVTFEDCLSKERCCTERSKKDGSFIPWLSQIDNVNQLYQTGKQRSHPGREHRDHHRAYLRNNRPDVTSFEWQPLLSLRECCQGWWHHIKLTDRIFSRLPIHLPFFLHKLIYTALSMHRTRKKRSELYHFASSRWERRGTAAWVWNKQLSVDHY